MAQEKNSIMVECKEIDSSAGVAQWTELRPMNQRVVHLITSQDTCLGCRPGPQERVRDRQPHIDISLPVFLLPFPFSLKINK